VETAQILGMQTANVEVDRVIAALTGRSASVPAAPAAAASPAPSSAGNAGPAPSSGASGGGGKPERKIPARARNFEITQGRQVIPPINMNNFNVSMKASLEDRKWNIDQEGTGYILASLRGGNWWVQIRVCYWEDEYWYEYINSDNLSADPARNRIHRNYDNWIKNLESSIKNNYYQR
jgi:hypothetical protein